MPDSFQEFMVESLASQVDFAGKNVLEIGSDPWFLSAKAMRARGAATVVCSDLNEIWFGGRCEGVVTAKIDARHVDDILASHSIDIVYGINVLEHLPEIPVILNALEKVVKPGGVIMLHGHPIWTSARGHHAIIGHPGNWTVHFAEDNNPIPLWAHLTHTPAELLAVLDRQGVAEIDELLDWCFHSDLITRKSRSSIIADVRAGPFSVRHIWEDRLEFPDEQVLDRLKQSMWWNEEEDYSVRGITFILDV